MAFTHLHPDDVLFFNEVRTAMMKVARSYGLAVRSIEPLAMPEAGMAGRLGDCDASGAIRLVMRATVNGEWCAEPRTPELVWRTAAHELAHLRHFNHGVGHHEFTTELHEALDNLRENHQEKVLRRLVKMQAQREDAARRAEESGSEEASAEAEAFASAINRMLIEHELSPSDIDYAHAASQDPVIEVRVDLTKYRIEKVSQRVAWQETLARVVASAHLCSYLIMLKTNNITFVGTRSHAMVAEYVYGVLVASATKMSERARTKFRNDLRKKLGIGPGRSIPTAESKGYRESWLGAFIDRIEERLKEARAAAVTAAPEGSSVALVRLDGALVKVRRYIDDKFTARRRTASSLHGHRGSNAAGRMDGRAAANAVTIGKAVASAAPVRGLLR